MTDVAGAGEVQEQQQVEPSLDDTLNAKLDEVFKAADQIEGRPPEEGTQQQPQRGPDGKFVARAAEQQAQQQEVQDQIPEAPASWSSVKAHWPTLSPEVRQALIERDAADEKSRTEHGERLKGYESLERIIGPRREGLAKAFGNEAVALEHLFALSDMAGKDFPGFVRFLAEQRGMDLNDLFKTLTQQQASADPNINALQREVADLKSKLTDREKAEQQEQERQAQKLIDEFKGRKSDKGELLFPHFEAVKEQIGGLLKAGTASTLEQAYKIAVAADDKLQAKIRAAEDDAVRKRMDEEAKAKANAARRTQRSDLATSSGASSSRPKTLDDSLRAAIEAAGVT